MGDRFYEQQLKKLGTCPGFSGKRKKRMAWTDEKKEEVIAAYEAANPTAENSLEIIREIAEEFEESPNGVRMILVRAGVYVKKAPAASKPSNGGGGGGRVSKVASQEALSAAISDAGQEVDEDVISKLTGKAAVYLTGIINAIKG
jgi:hypothetical protein